MGHIPEDENFEEYMNASADEWSKPEEPKPVPDMANEQVDRWGSPIPQEATIDDGERWGSEPLETAQKPAKSAYEPPAKKSGTKWWIIVVAVLLVLALCCLIVVGLAWAGLSIFQTESDFFSLVSWLTII